MSILVPLLEQRINNPWPAEQSVSETAERRGERRREAVSGFCLNVGLCCVNKFKVERARLGVVAVEGRRKALLGCLKTHSKGKLWHCMVAMTENLQILYPGMGSTPLERAPQPSEATLVLHCYLLRSGSLVNYRNQTGGFFFLLHLVSLTHPLC